MIRSEPFIILILTTLCAILAFAKIPKQYTNYYHARSWLIAALLLVIAGCSAEMLFLDDEGQKEILQLIVTLVSVSQATLFTYLSLTLLNSPRVNAREILLTLLPYIATAGIYFTGKIILTDQQVYTWSEWIDHRNNPLLIIRTLMTLSYPIMIVYFVILFRKELHRYRQRIAMYSSEAEMLKMRLGTLLFYLATFVGVIAFLFLLCPNPTIELILTLSITVLYTGITINFLNHNNHVAIITHASLLSEKVENEQIVEDEEPAFEEMLNLRIQELQAQDLFYCTPHITSADVANLLSIDPRRLSRFLNRYYGKNFNQWINEQRVEKAKELMSQPNHLPLVEIAEQVGFSDLPHLSREFKRIAGLTPSQFRKTSS